MPSRKRKRNRGKRRGKSSGRRWWEKNSNQSPIFHRTVRYNATAAFNSYITARCVLNSVVMFDSVASAEAVLVMDAFRLRRVRIAYLSTSGFGTSAGEVGFTWLGEKAPEIRITSRGTSFCPAHIDLKPRRGSYADMWFNLQDNIEAVLFNCDFPADSIIEISYQFTLAEGTDSNAIACTNPGTGLWYAALDNSTTAPALAGLLLRPDYLNYVVLTGVTSASDDERILRQKVLQDLIDAAIVKESTPLKLLGRRV